jgi:hypothetical protein
MKTPYLCPPKNLRCLEKLAWELGRDAGFVRRPIRIQVRGMRAPYVPHFKAGYRVACLAA